MIQLAVSEELASTFMAKAERNRCTPQDLLQSMLFRLESDEAFADALWTTALGERIVADLREVDKGNFTTSDEVDAKFDALFRNLRAK